MNECSFASNITDIMRITTHCFLSDLLFVWAGDDVLEKIAGGIIIFISDLSLPMTRFVFSIQLS